jgi:hypothetical protein
VAILEANCSGLGEAVSSTPVFLHHPRCDLGHELPEMDGYTATKLIRAQPRLQGLPIMR